ncbi:MAG: YkgJ family cysteine cluster protein [Clostridia bacterium]|nr:YkgJ family cysteine cluster protein [Clostridia bacterium]
MECRIGCAACCIDISITSSIPGMPEGKSAGQRCIQLTEDNRCKLFGRPDRPKVCISFSPAEEYCGSCNEEAHDRFALLEKLTKPNSK